jgi:hypothetical protein
VSAGYYLYVVMVMFMKPRDSAVALPAPTGGWTRSVVWGSVAVILIFGLFPDAIVSFTRRSAPALTTDAPAGANNPPLQRTAGGSAPEVVSMRPGLSISGR